MSERLGLFGGTFDPPHVGHLLLAYEALERLALDAVVFIPASRQPLKARTELAAPTHRLAMTRLLAAADPRLRVDPIEVDRGGLSYSVDTVRAYRAARPRAELAFLMGDDTAATLPQWKDHVALGTLARLVVFTRDTGASTPAPGLAAGSRLERLPTRRLDVSATEIRARVRSGLPIRGFVPDAVADYIATHRLYLTTNQ